MPTYFFHVRDSAVLRDETGTELPDEDAARREAVRLLGALIGDNPKGFWDQGRWCVEVQDKSGVTVATLDVLGHAPIR